MQVLNDKIDDHNSSSRTKSNKNIGLLVISCLNNQKSRKQQSKHCWQIKAGSILNCNCSSSQNLIRNFLASFCRCFIVLKNPNGADSKKLESINTIFLSVEAVKQILL